MALNSVAAIFGNLNVDVVDAAIYHEHDHDTGRYRYRVIRYGQRSRGSSGGRWLGTPDLSPDDNNLLYFLACEKGLVHADMKNYHPEKDAEYSELHKKHSTFQFQATENVQAKLITEAERAYNRRKLASRNGGFEIKPFRARKRGVKRHVALRKSVEVAKQLLQLKGSSASGGRPPPPDYVRQAPSFVPTTPPTEPLTASEDGPREEGMDDGEGLKPQPVPGFELDWSRVTIGDEVVALDKDGFWLNAKVVKMGTWDEPASLKVHFIGWNSRHDEWMRAGDLKVRALHPPPPPPVAAPPAQPTAPMKYGYGTLLDFNRSDSSEDEDDDVDDDSSDENVPVSSLRRK